ncbi:DUF3944 domain-containing protein [Castellaniella sp.]|uniref:DUF3944 domain-containing protein n=1 Tax=Castellaniella sp. TaxID=1955812 RepID=UPI002AFED7FE|nr:DUF3944 domain-containing protein [Castellaniella sp.]
MAYRNDVDLDFLEEIPSEDLVDLVDCLIVDKDGKSRYTEELTGNDLYKKYHPDHTRYWHLIAAEIQCFGANSLSTLFRGGKGVLYREVLTDVCDKMGAKYKKNNEVIMIENNLMTKIIEDSLGKMTEPERAEFAKIIGIDNVLSLSAAGLTAAIQALFRMGGFASYRLTLVIANAISRSIVGHGLSLAGNAALVRAASILTGPVGWALAGLWTVVDLAGPADRVTIPAVINVALLRKRYQAEKEGIMGDIEKELDN